MAQIFHRSMNTLSRLSIFGAVFFALGLLVLTYLLVRSPYQTDEDVVRVQPVPFSHEHHSRGLGIDCRYCHTSVEYAGYAGMPPTYTCMSCHSQIWTESPVLAPVRASLADDQPIRWTKVHDLPDFVYFHHGVHIQKGIGCSSCHGRVDTMPLMWKEEPMTMEWCLNCHRNPERYVRPREEVFNLAWMTSSAEQAQLGRELVEKYQIPTDGRLTNCSVCHR